MAMKNWTDEEIEELSEISGLMEQEVQFYLALRPHDFLEHLLGEVIVLKARYDAGEYAKNPLQEVQLLISGLSEGK